MARGAQSDLPRRLKQIKPMAWLTKHEARRFVGLLIDFSPLPFRSSYHWCVGPEDGGDVAVVLWARAVICGEWESAQATMPQRGARAGRTALQLHRAKPSCRNGGRGKREEREKERDATDLWVSCKKRWFVFLNLLQKISSIIWNWLFSIPFILTFTEKSNRDRWCCSYLDCLQ
jgi:hypothetical protein